MAYDKKQFDFALEKQSKNLIAFAPKILLLLLMILLFAFNINWLALSKVN
jgi:hypothetical protein